MFNKYILFLVQQNCHKNIISRCLHIIVIQEMVLETPYRENIQYKNSSKCRKILIPFGPIFFFVTRVLLSVIHPKILTSFCTTYFCLRQASELTKIKIGTKSNQQISIFFD